MSSLLQGKVKTIAITAISALALVGAYYIYKIQRSRKRASLLFHEASAAIDSKQLNEAIEKLNEALNIRKEFKFYLNRAAAYAQLDDWKRSFDDASNALNLPHDEEEAFEAMYWKARAATNLSKLNTAKKLYKSILEKVNAKNQIHSLASAGLAEVEERLEARRKRKEIAESKESGKGKVDNSDSDKNKTSADVQGKKLEGNFQFQWPKEGKVEVKELSFHLAYDEIKENFKLPIITPYHLEFEMSWKPSASNPKEIEVETLNYRSIDPETMVFEKMNRNVSFMVDTNGRFLRLNNIESLVKEVQQNAFDAVTLSTELSQADKEEKKNLVRDSMEKTAHELEPYILEQVTDFWNSAIGSWLGQPKTNSQPPNLVAMRNGGKQIVQVSSSTEVSSKEILETHTNHAMQTIQSLIGDAQVEIKSVKIPFKFNTVLETDSMRPYVVDCRKDYETTFIFNSKQYKSVEIDYTRRIFCWDDVSTLKEERSRDELFKHFMDHFNNNCTTIFKQLQIKPPEKEQMNDMLSYLQSKELENFAKNLFEEHIQQGHVNLSMGEIDESFAQLCNALVDEMNRVRSQKLGPFISEWPSNTKLELKNMMKFFQEHHHLKNDVRMDADEFAAFARFLIQTRLEG